MAKSKRHSISNIEQFQQISTLHKIWFHNFHLILTCFLQWIFRCCCDLLSQNRQILIPQICSSNDLVDIRQFHYIKKSINMRINAHFRYRMVIIFFCTWMLNCKEAQSVKHDCVKGLLGHLWSFEHIWTMSDEKVSFWWERFTRQSEVNQYGGGGGGLKNKSDVNLNCFRTFLVLLCVFAYIRMEIMGGGGGGASDGLASQIFNSGLLFVALCIHDSFISCMSKAVFFSQSISRFKEFGF